MIQIGFDQGDNTLGQSYDEVCMSQPNDEERLELHLLTRGDDLARPEIAELLTVVAHYHRTERRLGLSHSINFGRPRLSGSFCTHGVISLPYLDGRGLEFLAKPKVRFLWLIPVTEAEVRFKKQHEMTALEDRFEQAHILTTSMLIGHRLPEEVQVQGGRTSLKARAKHRQRYRYSGREGWEVMCAAWGSRLFESTPVAVHESWRQLPEDRFAYGCDLARVDATIVPEGRLIDPARAIEASAELSEPSATPG